ncbi:MAG: hypothetical protein JWN69_2155 [Alphaproteobacteria bacterium]|nr:hypothetical protein [Alphaproteobacteria bacterium]
MRSVEPGIGECGVRDAKRENKAARSESSEPTSF